MPIATNWASCPKRSPIICFAWAGAMATTRSSAATRRSNGSSLDHVGKSPSRFDFKKLENLNGHYIREADDGRLADLVAPRLGLDGGANARCWSAPCPSSRRARTTFTQLADGAALPVRAAVRSTIDEARSRAARRRTRAALLGRRTKRLLHLRTGTPASVEAAMREVADSAGVKLGKLAQPLRAALTGRTTSPGIFDVLVLLGPRRKPGAHRRPDDGAE